MIYRIYEGVWKMTEVAENIAEIRTDVKWLKEAMKAHQNQHFKIYVMFFSSMLGAGLALIVALV